MSRTGSKKLSLAKETMRTLSTEELGAAGGGTQLLAIAPYILRRPSLVDGCGSQWGCITINPIYIDPLRRG